MAEAQEQKKEKTNERPKDAKSDQKGKKPEKIVVRNYIRVANTDLNGSLRTLYALKGIRGISFSIARILCAKTGIDKNKKATDLTKEEIKSIEEFLQNPDLPPWMKNRRKDFETGKDIHLYGEKLKIQKMNDVNALKSMRAYRGIRHETGLPVRGQRTRSGHGGRTVGVSKKKGAPTAKPAEAPKPAAEKVK